MPVDACPFVEPTVAEARVHARRDAVLAANLQEIRQIEAERRIAVIVAPDKAAVNENQYVTERTVELDRNAPVRIARRNVELAPVPAHAGQRITAAKRLISVRS